MNGVSRRRAGVDGGHQPRDPSLRSRLSRLTPRVRRLGSSGPLQVRPACRGVVNPESGVGHALRQCRVARRRSLPSRTKPAGVNDHTRNHTPKRALRRFDAPFSAIRAHQLQCCSACGLCALRHLGRRNPHYDSDPPGHTGLQDFAGRTSVFPSSTNRFDSPSVVVYVLVTRKACGVVDAATALSGRLTLG